MVEERIINAIASDVKSIIDRVPENTGIAQVSLCRSLVRDCFSAKSNLIDLLSKHPNWDADNLRIHFTADFTREIDAGAARDALKTLASCVHYAFGDWACASLYPSECPEEFSELCNFTYRLYHDYSVRQMFSLGGETDSDMVDRIRSILPDIKMQTGTKVTRTLMRILRQLGFEKLDKDHHLEATRAYSAYCDAVNPIKVTRHTVISVNPADFLLMSNGNSWSSCYVTSDYQGSQSDESGCYSIGTLEYALDKQTMLLYTVASDEDDKDVTYAPKYQRECFFWNGNTLVGSRCYPANDNISSSIYRDCREIVEKVVADCLGIPNVWRKVEWLYEYKGRGYFDPAHRGDPQFPGYELTYMPDEMRPEKDRFTIKAGTWDVPCVVCGGTLDRNDCVVCSCCSDSGYHCERCGWSTDDESDLIYIEYEGYVCEDCARTLGYRQCWVTGEWLHQDDMVYLVDEEEWVSESYATSHEGRNHYFRCEDCGDWYYNDYDLTYVQDHGYVCNSCIRGGDYFQCDECGSWFSRDDMADADDARCLCTDCIESSSDYYQCSNCDTYHRIDEALEHPETGELLCDSCYLKAMAEYTKKNEEEVA